MTEAQLQAKVTALCDRLGLLWVHQPDSRRIRGARGFVDLFIAGSKGVLFMEIKSEHGTTSAEQDQWLWILREAGQAAIVCRPSDWKSGLIFRQLEKLN